MALLQGHVTDPQDRPVPQATVYVVSAPDNVPVPDVALLTDDQGQFVMMLPGPGRYTIGARSDVWGPLQVEIEANREETIAIRLQYS